MLQSMQFTQRCYTRRIPTSYNNIHISYLSTHRLLL